MSILVYCMHSTDSLTSPVPLNAASNPSYHLGLHHSFIASVLSNIQSHLSLCISPHFILSSHFSSFFPSHQHSPPLLTLRVTLHLYRSSSTLVCVSLSAICCHQCPALNPAVTVTSRATVSIAHEQCATCSSLV